jgi:hypothetical protein
MVPVISGRIPDLLAGYPAGYRTIENDRISGKFEDK